MEKIWLPARGHCLACKGSDMIPLHRLLSRILWDKEYGSAVFEIGYWDRLQNQIVIVSFEKLVFEAGNKESFLAMSPDGNYQRIPSHRVRQVFRDGVLIWSRG